MARDDILVFYSSVNTKGKNDATGAFIPEAFAYAKARDVLAHNVIGVDCTKKANLRRDKVYGAIRACSIIREIAFFGHGWPTGIQFGITRGRQEDELASLLASKSDATKGTNVILYACLAAENDVRDSGVNNVGPATDGGFADVLRDKMVHHGIKIGHVDAHKTAGHATWNPYVIRFLCEDVKDPELGAEGGAWIVAPGSQYWKKWCNSIRNNVSGLRFRFPGMSELPIKLELESMKG